MKYFKVVWDYSQIVGDTTGDADHFPDLTPLPPGSTATIAANVSGDHPIQDAVDGRSVDVAPVACSFDTDANSSTKGQLLDPTGNPGVWLRHPSGLNPSDWNYTITVSIPPRKSSSFPFDPATRPFDPATDDEANPPADSVVDLALVAPVPSSAGNAVVVGPEGPQGETGPAGVVAADAPATYDPGTQTVGVAVGTTVGTVAAGDDERIVGAQSKTGLDAATKALVDDLTPSQLRAALLSVIENKVSGDAGDPASVIGGSLSATFGMQGHGFPEGVVTAPVGSLYTDLDATNGAIRWIKASGVGNTGWVVTHGDTGRRSVKSLLINGNTSAGEVVLDRVGSTVRLSTASGLDATARTSDHFLPNSAIPGFVPIAVSSETYGLVVGVDGHVTDIGEGAGALFIRGGHTTIYNFAASWITSDPWPSVLPGVAF